MKKAIATFALAPFAGLLLLGAANAQDLTLGEQTVPADQTAVVQDWCDELQAQQGLTGTQEPETTMTEEQAEAATATQGGEDAAAFDLTQVTLEQCQDAGLTAADAE